MFIVSQHVIDGEGFEACAREAVREAFGKNGHVPNAVLIPRANTTGLRTLVVGVGDPPVIQEIPIEVRSDLKIDPNGFGLDVSHGTLE